LGEKNSNFSSVVVLYLCAKIKSKTESSNCAIYISKSSQRAAEQSMPMQ